jgi:DNA primase
VTVDIVRVIGERVSLEKAGAGRYRALCPFHKERTPSFHVDAARGFFHCFGCGKGGDAARFIEMLDGLTYPQAERKLTERFKVTA